LPLVRYFKDL